MDDLRAFKGLTLGVTLGLLLWGCAACAADPAIRAYDRAAAMGLARERSERPYARLNDGAPFTRERRVEISR